MSPGETSFYIAVVGELMILSLFASVSSYKQKKMKKLYLIAPLEASFGMIPLYPCPTPVLTAVRYERRCYTS